MGRDKALLVDEGQTWLQRSVGLLRAAGCARVRIATRPGLGHEVEGVEMLYDRQEGAGPLEPIAHALATAHASQVLVLAVDLPRMTAAWLLALTARCTMEAGCVPRTPRGWEPLAACYPGALAGAAARHLAEGRRAPQVMIEEAVRAGRIRPWEVDGGDARPLHNANTPDDC